MLLVPAACALSRTQRPPTATPSTLAADTLELAGDEPDDAEQINLALAIDGSLPLDEQEEEEDWQSWLAESEIVRDNTDANATQEGDISHVFERLLEASAAGRLMQGFSDKDQFKVASAFVPVPTQPPFEMAHVRADTNRRAYRWASQYASRFLFDALKRKGDMHVSNVALVGSDMAMKLIRKGGMYEWDCVPDRNVMTPCVAPSWCPTERRLSRAECLAACSREPACGAVVHNGNRKCYLKRLLPGQEPSRRADWSSVTEPDDPRYKTVGCFRRAGNSTVAEVERARSGDEAALYEALAQAAGAHLLWFSGPMQLLNATVGSCNHLVPTLFEIEGRGLVAVDEEGGSVSWADRHASSTPLGQVLPWEERVAKLFYRGSPNDPLRDAIFTMGRDPGTSDWLNATNDSAPVADFGHHKYVADIGGLSGTTWNALRNKLRMGSLVFLVDSGYADWWHADLRPWEHYVPVKADSSDLHEQFLWAEAHPADARAIAEAGKAKERESSTEEARQACLARVLDAVADTACPSGRGV